MRTFQLRSGDLVLSGNSYGMVEGTARVQQQLSLGLREPYGGDRFHPGWGSVLPEWIGRVLDRQTLEQDVRTEIIRIVKNFMSSQSAIVRNRAVSGLRPVLSPSEVIADITDIRISQSQDSLIVKATLRMASGQEFAVMTSPGRPDGYTQ
jgi:hypothetical protein